MFITPAYAQGLGGGAEMFAQIVPIILMFVIFYFLLIRPQQQRAKKHQELVAGVRRGDNVILSGGIIGKVNRVREGDPEVDVEIAQGTVIKVLRSAIADVRNKGEPVKE